MKHEAPPGLGRAIQVRRAELGIGRRELAERAELSYPYLSAVENGKKAPSAKAMWRLARALEMPVPALYERAERSTLGEATARSSPEEAAAPLDMMMMLPDVGLERVPPRRRSERSGPPAGLSQQRADELLERVAEVVATTVRTELADWAETELPDLMRQEVERIVSTMRRPGRPLSPRVTRDPNEL